MQIADAHYVSPDCIRATIDGVTMDIAVPSGSEPGSRYYAAVIAAGGIAPYTPPPPAVPSKVSAAQARVALFRAGLLSAIDAAVTAAGGEIAIWYEYATEWQRDSPHIAALAGGLNLTAQQIDGLFIEAAGVV